MANSSRRGSKSQVRSFEERRHAADRGFTLSGTVGARAPSAEAEASCRRKGEGHRPVREPRRALAIPQSRHLTGPRRRAPEVRVAVFGADRLSLPSALPQAPFRRGRSAAQARRGADPDHPRMLGRRRRPTSSVVFDGETTLLRSVSRRRVPAIPKRLLVRAMLKRCSARARTQPSTEERADVQAGHGHRSVLE